MQLLIHHFRLDEDFSMHLKYCLRIVTYRSACIHSTYSHTLPLDRFLKLPYAIHKCSKLQVFTSLFNDFGLWNDNKQNETAIPNNPRHAHILGKLINNLKKIK